MNDKKEGIKIIKTACVYIGMMFGAGFASGQEHMAFFLRFGGFGIFGIVLAGVFIALCGWAIMDICVRQKIVSYKEFMELIFGRQLGAFLDIVSGAFIFVMLCAMLAGAGVLGGQAMGLSFSIGVIVMGVLCFVVLLFDIRGMVEINTFISPVLVAGSLMLGLYAIFGDAAPAFAASIWPVSAAIYASYNMLPAVAVLTAMPHLIASRGIAKKGAFLGGFILIVIGVVLGFAMLINMGYIGESGLPMLALAQGFGQVQGYLYTFILFLAIITTAVANSFSLANWLASRISLPKLSIKIGIIVLACFAAHLGFANIVSYGYSFFGFLGLFVVIAILIYFFKSFKTKK